VSVGTKVIDIAQDRFTMKYIIVSHKHQKVAADGDGLIVMYNYHEGKKTAIPEEIRQRIMIMEKIA